MNWFKNLKIGKKLVFSFIFVAFIAGAIGFEGITSLKTVENSDTILYEMNTVPLSILGKISTAYQRQRTNILEVIFASDVTLKADQHKRISDRSVEIDQLTLEYKKSIRDDLDKKLYEEFSSGLIAFYELREKVLMLADQNNFEEARLLYRGDMETARKNVQVKIEKLNEMNINDAKERSEQNTTEANSSITLMIVLVFGGVVLSIFLGIFISRLIGNPVKILTDAATKMANGDTKVDVKIDSLDELGTLASAFNIMVEKIEMQIQYLDNLPTPVMIVDKEFSVTYMNKMGAQVVGITQESCSNQKCYNLFKTEHCNTPECRVRQAMEEKAIRSGETVAKPQGKDIHIMYTGAPVLDRFGSLLGGLEFVADISVAKENQNYLTRATNTLLVEMDRFSEGDLTVEVVPEKENDDIGKLFHGFNKSVQNIRRIVKNVKEAVEATASASTQISSSAEEMAAGAQEQSSQTAEVAAAMEEMSRTIVETANNATVSAEASREASVQASEGSVKLNQSKDGMHRIVISTETVGKNISSLVNKTEQIGAIAQVIDDIADQTNLLALNAAIEAARAGEHGRGFAVVADEVRKLAENTTKATKEIANTIKSIQTEAKDANASMKEAGDAVNNGLLLNNEVGEVLGAILKSINNVTDQISQVAAASEEQSATAEQVSSNIESINNVANESAVGVQQIASASEDLNRLTENLSNLVSQFQVNNTENGRKFGHDHKLLV